MLSETEEPRPHPSRLPTISLSDIYNPLEDGQIRLLKLTCTNQKSISCNLQTVDIGCAPAYFSLSYVCGPVNNDFKVTVNGHTLKIGHNLYTALQRLANHFDKVQIDNALIWVDAISINQADLAEKAAQIRELHRIFSKAKEVLVCLGPVPPDVLTVLHVFRWAGLYAELMDQLPHGSTVSDLEHICNVHESLLDPGPECLVESSWEFYPQCLSESLWEFGLEGLSDQLQKSLKDLAKYTRTLERMHNIEYTQILALAALLRQLKGRSDWGPQSSDRSAIMREVMKANTALEKTLPRPQHAFWSGLKALVKVEWFSRVWTFQEIQLARQATFLADGLHIDWALMRLYTFDLLQACYGARLLESIADPRDGTIASDMHPEFRLPSQYWHQFVVQKKGKAPLSGALLFTGTRKATLAKDHVYGILGLLNAKSKKGIKVDFNLAGEEVFAVAVKACLRLDYKLAMNLIWSTRYEEVKLDSPMSDLPSWCPDLRVNMRRDVISWPNYLHEDVRKKYAPYANYEDTNDLKTIALRVFRLDKVTRFTSRSNPLVTALQDPHAESRHVTEAITWMLEACETLEFADNEALKQFLELDQQDVDSMSAAVSPDRRSYNYDTLTSRARLSLQRQANRFIFQTTSGMIGFSARRPVHEALIVLVPESWHLQMLSADATNYVGIASIPVLGDRKMLDPPPNLENSWEMVHLA